MVTASTLEKVNCTNKSSAASYSSGFRLASNSILSPLKGMSCCSARDVLVSLSKTISSRINLSQRMNELAEQLQKSEEKVRNAVQTESLKNAEPEDEEAVVRALACLEGENLSTIINWDELSSGIFQSILDLLKETKFLRALRLLLCSQDVLWMKY
ncbi:hypothetical protein FCM35_KLT00535 [Carex littledalei]|uniref:Uncharacterized protein n=1 Tax=Carex littledalei TaxID=544730 RepID=A0A833RJS1_9POAL|nr:hypothetical protein FCM35_KLT00535 [Carex littledalei]